MYPVALESMEVLLKSVGNIANTFTELSQTVECAAHIISSTCCSHRQKDLCRVVYILPSPTAHQPCYLY